jgi:hypothetical protein
VKPHIARKAVMAGAVVSALLALNRVSTLSAQDLPSNRCDLALVVLADLTRVSWPKESVRDLRDAVEHVVSQMVGASAAVVVGGVADQIKISSFLKPSEVVAATKQVFEFPWNRRFGNALVWDGLYTAINRLSESDPERTRTIVVVTAGRPTGNVRTFEEVVARAREAGVTIHSIVRPMYEQVMVQAESDTAFRISPSLIFEDVSRLTGGTLLKSKAIDTATVEDNLRRVLRLSCPAER